MEVTNGEWTQFELMSQRLAVLWEQSSRCYEHRAIRLRDAILSIVDRYRLAGGSLHANALKWRWIQSRPVPGAKYQRRRGVRYMRAAILHILKRKHKLSSRWCRQFFATNPNGRNLFPYSRDVARLNCGHVWTRGSGYRSVPPAQNGATLPLEAQDG